MCSTVCLMSRTISLAAASYSHLIVIHSAVPVARPADAFKLPLTESIGRAGIPCTYSAPQNIDESALPCPCQSSIQLSRDGGLRKPYGLVPGISGMAFPCFLQRHGV